MLKFSPANAKTENLTRVPSLAERLQGKRKVYSLDLTSGLSCPGARDCHSWVKTDPLTGRATIQDGPHCQFRCFAASQEVMYPALRAMRARNFEALRARSADSVAKLVLKDLPKNAGIVRLHVGGDFFSVAYLTGLVLVAFERPDVLFYAYTKSLDYLERVVQDIPAADLKVGRLLPNFLVTGSAGGKHDQLLGGLGLRQARVVFSEAEAAELNLPIDHDDSHAATVGGSFALLIHGTQPAGSVAGKALTQLKGVGSYSRKGG